MKIRGALPSDQDTLIDIWLRSVRASHTFLTEEDIQSLLPAVVDYFALPQLELWVLCTGSDRLRNARQRESSTRQAIRIVRARATGA